MSLAKNKSLARVISNIINPFLVTFVVVILLAVRSTAGVAEALKWSAILIGVSVLPVFVFVLYQVGKRKLGGIFVSSRQQRVGVYLLSSTCAVIGCGLLFYLGAPPALTATFVAGLASIVIFMVINCWWKISLHTGFTAGAVTVLIISFGVVGVATAVLLPPVAWARTELKQHSLWQVTAGACLAALLVVVVFALFGLLGGGA